MTERVLQRIVMPLRRKQARLYYRSDGATLRSRKRDRRTIVLPRGTVLRTDAWFNAFFEAYWRKHTQLSQLVLRSRVSGAGILRLYRRSPEQGEGLLQEIAFSGQDREVWVELADDGPVSGNFGLLFCELEATSSRMVMHQAEWMVCNVETQPTRLAACFCTFNRASRLIRNITALRSDSDVAELLDQVLVVDQGTEKVRDHPSFPMLARAAAGRLLLVEQDNRGGSGGFTRCLLEAQNAGSATHVVLMDDDIVVEPESLLRAAAFLSLARGDLAVGGHMLDRFRPCQLVESGSRYLPEQARIDEPSRRRVDRADDLLPFVEPQSRHYIGWWLFAVSLSVLERAGLPLPLFLRGDDVEFGCRLMRRGVPTLALPGVAVWHEPFERKGRGWHAFYELRNLLIVGALHFPLVRASTVARRFLSRLLDELLAYDYYDAWLMCEAAAAYLRGPEELRRPPQALHHHVRAMSEQLAPRTEPRDGKPQVPLSPPPPLRPDSTRVWRWLLVLRNLLLPSPSSDVGPQQVLQGSGEQWYDIAGADVVAVAEPHRPHLLLLRRSRGRFVRLFFRGLWLAIRLLFSHRRAVRHWRADASTLTSQGFWTEFLQWQRRSSESRPSKSGWEGRSLTAAAQSSYCGIDRGNNESTKNSLLQLG